MTAIPHPSVVRPFQVLPWNGYQAALSLTFDDGDPIHLELAGPELSKRRLRGSFYVVVNRVTQPAEWKAILSAGHEIGNHSLDHKHARDLTPDEEKRQVAEAKDKLQEILGASIHTFAYPFSEITPGLKKQAQSHHALCRGGGGPDYNYYLTPEMEPDWANIPSQVALTALPYDTYRGWMDQCLAKKAWTVLMLHGIEGSLKAWQPITKRDFTRLLDDLLERQKNLWIAPFLEVGAYWRAQKILGNAPPHQNGSATTFIWDKPHPFPGNVFLKVRVGNGFQPSQYGRALQPGPDGSYLVSFDANELTIQS